MVPTRARGSISPPDVDALDITVVAVLLGLDRDRSAFEDDWNRMRRLRLEAAAAGKTVQWEDLA